MCELNHDWQNIELDQLTHTKDLPNNFKNVKFGTVVRDRLLFYQIRKHLDQILFKFLKQSGEYFHTNRLSSLALVLNVIIIED